MALIGSIDQGTQSTKFTVLDVDTNVVCSATKEHRQIHNEPGWCEHDPLEILEATKFCIRQVCNQIPQTSIVAVGLANQRETVVVWDSITGKPLHNAIVWSDVRAGALADEWIASHGGGSIDALKGVTGLPMSPYFSAFKILWLQKNIPEVAQAIKSGRASIGTIDSWLVWNLTKGRVFVTDITNASRTFLMDVNSCDWSERLLELFNIPLNCLPRIRSSSEVYGNVDYKWDDGMLGNVPIAGILGDQQASCLGHRLFDVGEVKLTYGTGAFLLMNTGTKRVSSHRLLTTPCFQLGPDAPVIWAIEGAVPVAGAGVTWLRHSLGLIEKDSDTADVLRRTEDSNGVVFVPAFSGLLAPRWRADARGCICGLTQAASKDHIVRALMESICFQVYEVLEAMREDACTVTRLKLDGGMTQNEPFIQLNADLLQLPIETTQATTEATTLGAAFAAGLATKFWDNDGSLKKLNGGETLHHEANISLVGWFIDWLIGFFMFFT
eukprot:TRINITY_DN15383_c1_g1_i2.p1 TRINITY_DN15383_c1_g1~~TRINITY_DN15383_c1_g1_i2.p1  ORF type:complete len:496 (+),score=43.61 TRINITY_DN15383_c1_g1_i2:168-1655(+)